MLVLIVVKYNKEIIKCKEVRHTLLPPCPEMFGHVRKVYS